jgi:hypothetical protein
MPDKTTASAIIIPFPLRKRPGIALAPIEAVGAAETVGLARVMGELDIALTRQTAAVASWRTSIQHLRVALDSLDASLRHFHVNLETPAPGASHQRR